MRCRPLANSSLLVCLAAGLGCMGSERAFAAIGPRFVGAPAGRPPASLASSPAERPRVLPTREVFLDLNADSAFPLTQAEAWYAIDGGWCWQPICVDLVRARTARIVLPHDGAFDLYIIVHNAHGPSAPPPDPGDVPTVHLEVDSTPPLVQLVATRTQRRADGDTNVALDLVLIEERPAGVPLRLFWKDASNADAPWRDGGPLAINGLFSWTPPSEPPDVVDLSIVATDVAGNRAMSRLAKQRIRPDGPVFVDRDDVSRAAPAPAPTVANAARTVDSDAPELAADVAPESPSTQPAPTAADAQRSRALSEIAADLLRAGRYDLAIARLSEAVQADPSHSDAALALADAYRRTERAGDAARALNDLLSRQPTHVGALRRLARLELDQRRFDAAEQALDRLARIAPPTPADWLLRGDVELRRGNRSAAERAWQSARDAASDDDPVREQARRRLAAPTVRP